MKESRTKFSGKAWLLTAALMAVAITFIGCSIIIDESGVDATSIYSSELSVFADETILESIQDDLERSGNDVFAADIIVDDKIIPGFGFSDRTIAYESPDGKTVYSCGFIAADLVNFPRDGSLYVENLRDIDSDDEYRYILNVSPEGILGHFILEHAYVTYTADCHPTVTVVKLINDAEDKGEYLSEITSIADLSIGSLYSYDDETSFYEAAIGSDYKGITGVSTVLIIDPEVIRNQVIDMLSTQIFSSTSFDYETCIAISIDAVNAYILSLADETFMGVNTQELKEYALQAGEYDAVRYTSSGFTIDVDDMRPPEETSEFLKFLTGLVIAVAVVAAVAITIANPALALAGAFIGAAIEGVIQGINGEFNFERILIASVAGIVGGACGIFSGAIIGGITEGVFAVLDGASDIEILKRAGFAMVAGVAMGKAFELAGTAIKASKAGFKPIYNKVFEPNPSAKLKPVMDIQQTNYSYSTKKAIERELEKNDASRLADYAETKNGFDSKIEKYRINNEEINALKNENYVTNSGSTATSNAKRLTELETENHFIKLDLFGSKNLSDLPAGTRIPEGDWSSKMGDSIFLGKSQAFKDKVSEFGTNGVQYVNGYPDYRPFTHYDSIAVDGKELKDVNLEVIVENMGDPLSAKNLVMKVNSKNGDNLDFIAKSNLISARENLAKKLSISVTDVMEIENAYKLTWVMKQDMKTMQLIPSVISKEAEHSDGLAAISNVIDSLMYRAKSLLEMTEIVGKDRVSKAASIHKNAGVDIKDVTCVTAEPYKYGLYNVVVEGKFIYNGASKEIAVLTLPSKNVAEKVTNLLKHDYTLQQMPDSKGSFYMIKPNNGPTISSSNYVDHYSVYDTGDVHTHYRNLLFENGKVDVLDIIEKNGEIITKETKKTTMTESIGERVHQIYERITTDGHGIITKGYYYVKEKINSLDGSKYTVFEKVKKKPTRSVP